MCSHTATEICTYYLISLINKLGNGGNSQDKIVERVFLKKKKKR